MSAENYLSEVRAQYEFLPYPPRDPADEKRGLVRTYGGALDSINHYCFEGRESFADFRVLMAGDGTGDATLFLAEQLRGREVVYFDISAASLDVARQRARVRGLSNIEFLHASINQIPDLGLGQFDYIYCCGVLHHLADPTEGLRNLAAALKPEGALCIMVYAPYGRVGIYAMQELLRQINEGIADQRHKLETAKRLLPLLPPTNLFKRLENKGGDHITMGDTGLYDLLLHSRDRAYSVPELYEWVESCGLTVRHFLNTGYSYDPAAYLSDRALLERIGAMSLKKRQAIAELMAGDMRKHTFYASLKPVRFPTIENEDNVPFLASMRPISREDLLARVENNKGRVLRINTDHFSIYLTIGEYTESILRHLDGLNSIGGIYGAVRAEFESKGAQVPALDILRKEFRTVFSGFNAVECMLLREPGTKPLSSPPFAIR